MKRADEKIVYALFDTMEDLQKAFDKLIEEGVAVEDISILMSEETRDRDFPMLEKNKALEGATAGGLIGGALGGILGGLAALGTVISGIGLVVVGPALAFAAAGGLIGGFMGRGIPEDEAKRMQDALRDGKVLMAVHLEPRKEAVLTKEIFDRFGGERLDM